MKYEHPTIQIQSPAPGHYVVTGHNPAPVFIPDVGHIVPPRECYIPPELPSEVLFLIIEERAAQESEAEIVTSKGGRE